MVDYDTSADKITTSILEENPSSSSSYIVLSRFSDGQTVAEIGYAAIESVQLDIDNPENGILVERIEHDPMCSICCCR